MARTNTYTKDGSSFSGSVTFDGDSHPEFSRQWTDMTATLVGTTFATVMHDWLDSRLPAEEIDAQIAAAEAAWNA